MRHRGSGFTMAELAVVISIASVIGLAVVGVSTALSTAYAHSQDYYQCIQSGRAGMRRVQSLLRKAKLIPAVSDDSLVIWREDATEDGKINLDEITVLEYDASARAVRRRQVVFPDSMQQAVRDAMNVEIPLYSLTSFSEAAGWIRGAYATSTEIVAGVESFEVSPMTAPPLSRLIRIELVTQEGPKQIRLRSAVTLRADRVESVGMSEDGYVLSD